MGKVAKYGYFIFCKSSGNEVECEKIVIDFGTPEYLLIITINEISGKCRLEFPPFLF